MASLNDGDWFHLTLKRYLDFDEKASQVSSGGIQHFKLEKIEFQQTDVTIENKIAKQDIDEYFLVPGKKLLVGNLIQVVIGIILNGFTICPYGIIVKFIIELVLPS